MTVAPRRAMVRPSAKEADMHALMMFIVFAFVVGVGAVIVWALFEMSPFAHHVDQFRDPVTGRKRGESPHLE